MRLASFLIPTLALLPSAGAADTDSTFFSRAREWASFTYTIATNRLSSQKNSFGQTISYSGPGSYWNPSASRTGSNSKSKSKSKQNSGPGSGSAGMAEVVVHNLTTAGWKHTLASEALMRPGWTVEWMVLVTEGGPRQTDRGRAVVQAWEESLPLFGALDQRPNLGVVDCDISPGLCLMWLPIPVEIWHFLITAEPDTGDTISPAMVEHAKGSPLPRLWGLKIHSAVRRFDLNGADAETETATDTAIDTAADTTTTTPISKLDIVTMYTEEKWKHLPLYQSAMFHPFNGFLTRHGIEDWVRRVAGLVKSPSWLFAIAVTVWLFWRKKIFLVILVGVGVRIWSFF